MQKQLHDAYSVEEVSRRADEVIRRMANTPPQPKPSPHPKTKKKADADHAADKSRAIHED